MVRRKKIKENMMKDFLFLVYENVRDSASNASNGLKRRK
jgi:hypothetical protein